jgi:hypothetical protein
MPRTRNGTLPFYRRTGQATLTIDGHDHYLGPFDSLESRKKYKRLIDAGRARHEGDQGSQPRPSSPPQSGTSTINKVMLAYLRHAAAYYKPTSKGEQKEVGCRRRQAAATAAGS